MGIDDRKKKVLEAIVKDYIATAEPVGSRTIARKYNLGVSPATIRNEMADLEELGLIEQPHTSAGRIPSDKGYRLFVDCLMQKQGPSTEEESLVLTLMQKRRNVVEQMIQETSRVLSQLTSYTTLATVPGSTLSTIEQIQIINVAPSKAVLVVVDRNGAVQHQILEVPEWLGEIDLRHIADVINRQMGGLNPDRLTRTVLEGVFQELNRYRMVLDQVIGILEPGSGSENADRVFLGGTLNILNQPEFREVARLKSLLGMLEEEGLVRNLLTESGGQGLTIKIGGENRITEIQDCSLVTATYELNGRVIGTIGLLGPTRMDYSRAAGLIEFMTTVLSDCLEKFYSG